MQKQNNIYFLSTNETLTSLLRHESPREMLAVSSISSSKTVLRAVATFTLCWLMFASFRVSAQRDTAFFRPKESLQPTLLKTNLFPIFWGPIAITDTGNLSYPLTSEYRLMGELPIAPKQTFSVGISYLAKNILYVAAGTDTGQSARSIRNIGIRGFRAQGMFRYYLGKKGMAPNGFYVGPQASYSYAKVFSKTNKSYYYKFVNWNVNAMAGYQLVLGKAVSFDFFLGLGYKNNQVETHIPNKPVSRERVGEVLPHLKLSLGFNFGIAF